MNFRFLHAADIHLDSPLKNLAAREGAPVETIRGAGRRAFDNLIELAVVEEVDFLLLAGDLYDGSWKDYNTGLFFIDRMRRLRKAGRRTSLVIRRSLGRRSQKVWRSLILSCLWSIVTKLRNRGRCRTASLTLRNVPSKSYRHLKCLKYLKYRKYLKYLKHPKCLKRQKYLEHRKYLKRS